jgi:hypothetical protein
MSIDCYLIGIEISVIDAYVIDAYVLITVICYLLATVQPDDWENEIQDIQQAIDNSWMVLHHLYQDKLGLFHQG